MSAEELVRLTLDRAYTLALRLTGNEADAWDLTQDALLKAISGLDGFRDEADPRTWVYRITLNAWKNQVGSRLWKWWRRLAPIDPASGDPPSREDSPERSLDAKERAREFEAALSGLDPEDRATLVLRELDGMRYADIARTMDVPIGTVKSRLYRARAALARLLEKYDDA
ncbi:MAG: hypothetical protein A2X36_07205 [Elusimicrobia bacterium GWA2_69_24]|nr:MAG: hypothetical protein A2X36_07205 [Elusimicrobia bacterium GWA2_69_24]